MTDMRKDGKDRETMKERNRMEEEEETMGEEEEMMEEEEETMKEERSSPKNYFFIIHLNPCWKPSCSS